MFRYLVLLLVVCVTVVPAAPGDIPRPPYFRENADPAKVLAQYPLGVITKQLAFSYHGKAVKEVELPNGHIGWIYDVGGTPVHQEYVTPAGQEKRVLETDRSHAVTTYTLVFDGDVVVNVLYRDYDHDKEMSALQIQFKEPPVD